MKESRATYFSAESLAIIDGTKVKGILDNDYLQAGVGSGVETNMPVFICETKDIQQINHTDKLIVGGIKYDIIEARSDGTGVTVLRLHKS